MNLQINGFDTLFSIDTQTATELTIENKVLYSRIIRSLKSELGEQAIEPYRFLNSDDGTVSPRDATLLIDSPFSLPWDHRLLMGALYHTMEQRLLEEDETRIQLEDMALTFRTKIAEFGLVFQSDYAFEVEWSLPKYLKAFGYKTSYSMDETLLDNILRFISLASDVRLKRILVFVGLDNFLSDAELKILCEQAFFLGQSMLLLDNQQSNIECPYLRKYIIDQDLLES